MKAPIFCEFIDYIYKHLPEKHAKLAINSMIGFFEFKDTQHWQNVVKLCKDVNNMFYHSLNHDAKNIQTRNICYKYIMNVSKNLQLLKKKQKHHYMIIF